MKKVAILQSNYIPWKGYFDIINMVDEFIIYDTEQDTKRDWRNRNKIKTPQGAQWLSIPVKVKGKFYQKINESEVSSQDWREKHWKSIVLNYSKTPYFAKYKSIFEELYLSGEETYLSKINFSFIKAINEILNIKTKIRWSDEFQIKGEKSEKLLSICKELDADCYLSGPAAQSYLDEKLFQENNIKVEWMNYSNYPEYHQLYPPFNHQVTILDLIFNEGPDSKKYMKSFNQ